MILTLFVFIQASLLVSFFDSAAETNLRQYSSQLRCRVASLDLDFDVRYEWLRYEIVFRGEIE